MSRLGADPFLLHAPSVYDLHERDDMLSAYLSDSDTDSDNVTSIHEMLPIGWFLERHGGLFHNENPSIFRERNLAHELQKAIMASPELTASFKGNDNSWITDKVMYRDRLYTQGYWQRSAVVHARREIVLSSATRGRATVSS